MKATACIVALAAILVVCQVAPGQAPASAAQTPYEIRVSPEVAEKLLIHKADIICPRVAMPARVMATVVVAVQIGRNGVVLYSKVVSGPAMLRRPVLDAVRKYKYKPYLLNGKAVEVETTVSVTMDSFRDCHFN
jgi:protein TonB